MNENTIEQPTLEPEEELDENPSTTQEGSMIGKFKDAKSLLEAYNSLQSEFTRKSQKLAEFQKEFDKIAFFQNQSLDEILKDSTDMDKYKKEITEIISNDKELENLPNKYQVAFKIAKESERKLAEQLNKPNFIDKYVSENSDIASAVITRYLSNLNNIPSAPNVSSGGSSNIYFTPQTSKPTTIKDAGEIFSKMLK